MPERETTPVRRTWVTPARTVATVVLLVSAGTTAACGSGSPSQAPNGFAAHDSSNALCNAALGGRTVTTQKTTLGEVRRVNIGGPYPGLTPGKGAFPDLPDSAPAAWCWTAATMASPGSAGREWTWYVAVQGGRAKSLFSMGGIDHPPTGAPSIP